MRTKSMEGYFRKRFKKKSFMRAYKEARHLMDIGIAIASAREKVGFSQSDLAKKLGTTQSVISRIEGGNQNLTLNMLAKIAYFLHCELSMQMKPWRMAA